jgi:hypothetical protein
VVSGAAPKRLAERTVPPHGGPRVSSDLIVEVLTGDRTHFHLGPCGPFGEKPKGPKPQVYDAEFEKVRNRKAGAVDEA